MLQLTIADRVLEELRVTRKAWDDDQLAARLSVSPRQSINIVCRKLAAGGRIHRYRGPDGKLVNEANGAPAPRATAAATPPAKHELPPGSSMVQRQAERTILDLAGARLGVALEPCKIVSGNGVRVEVDGADADRTVLVEAWAHQGPAKVAQKHKVMTDALKLHWIAQTLPSRPRLVLCLSDELAAKTFVSEKTWSAAALRDLDIEVMVVDLPAELREQIREAQRRQWR